MEIWYFETSAINELLNTLSNEDGLATRFLQLSKGRDWRISPVTLWEILMTADEKRRDKIIHFCQHLFSRELLPSPGELIIPYIEQGLPKSEDYRELVSNTAIADTWRDLVDNRDKCFIIDYKEITKRVKMLQTLTKDIQKIIKHHDLVIDRCSPAVHTEILLSNLVLKLNFVKSDNLISKEDLLSYKVSLHLIIVLLCAEGDLDNEIIKMFWKKRGIFSTIDRIKYVIEELPTLVHRGPFMLMAYMAIAQAKASYSRGVWFDGLHSIYITYADKVFTSDNHFRALRESIPEPLLKMRIHHLDEVGLSYVNKK